MPGPYTSFNSADPVNGDQDHIVALNTLLTAYQGAGTATPIPSKPYLGAILLPDGTVGVAYSAEATIDPPSVLAPIAYTISSGSLPPGLSLSSPDSSREWEIGGTPTTAGSYTFTLTATNGLGSDSTSITIVILAAGYGFPVPVAENLAGGTVGTAYSETVSAEGGTSPYSFAVTGGALPGGLSMSSGGAISGTPTTAGTFTFTVTVTDTNGYTGATLFEIVVASSSGGGAATNYGFVA